MKVDVKLDNLHNLECFRNILEKYRDYKSFYRELKINYSTCRAYLNQVIKSNKTCLEYLK